jgi:hypothetical protein
VKSAISGTERWYAGGGAGGAVVTGHPADTTAYGATGGNDGEAGTGDGGSGGGGVNGKTLGGKGGSGIVIARFPYTAQ